MSRVKLPLPLFSFTEHERQCSYLPDETAQLEYRRYLDLTPAQVEHLVQRGWRRFASYMFRPGCADCSKCRSIRVDVNGFKESKSQRRTRKRNQHIRVSLHEADVTDDHVRLYNEWHVDMTERSGWESQQIDDVTYHQCFLEGEFESGHELRYYDGDEMVGVGLIEILPNSLSSSYFYHTPSWRPLGPGTFSALCEVDLAKTHGLDYIYFGYWIQECQSMAYKNRFRPFDLLTGLPDEDEPEVWFRPDDFETGNCNT